MRFMDVGRLTLPATAGDSGLREKGKQAMQPHALCSDCRCDTILCLSVLAPAVSMASPRTIPWNCKTKQLFLSEDVFVGFFHNK